MATLKFRVSYDRPRGLSSDGYEALVRGEQGPQTLEHVKALCKRWKVTARLNEWNADSFRHGTVDMTGKFSPPHPHDDRTRAYAIEQATACLRAAKVHEREHPGAWKDDVHRWERKLERLRGK